MKKILFIIAATLIIGTVTITLLCSTIETRENSYPTCSDAEKEGAIGSGRWIPALLPRSATDIKEIHNIDSNWTLLKFSFAKQELLKMVTGCDALHERDVSYPIDSHTKMVHWWPEDLSAHLTHGKARNRYKFYRCAVNRAKIGEQTLTDSEWLAVDESSLLAYFWRKSD